MSADPEDRHERLAVLVRARRPATLADWLATHHRLVAAGLSAERSRAFLHLLAGAEAGRFDRRVAHERLAAIGVRPEQAMTLIEELLQRLARHAGGGS